MQHVFKVHPCRSFVFFFLRFLFINLFLAVLGLHCCVDFSLVVVNRGYFPVVVCRLLTVVTSLVEQGLEAAQASVIVVHGLSCSEACGIFPDQGSNPCLLHWQVDCLPLNYQQSPVRLFILPNNFPLNG